MAFFDAREALRSLVLLPLVFGDSEKLSGEGACWLRLLFDLEAAPCLSEMALIEGEAATGVVIDDRCPPLWGSVSET